MEIWNRAASALTPPFRAVARDPLVIAITSLLVGSVAASLWPAVVGWFALVLLFLAVVRRFVEHRREQQRALDYTAFELALRQPDQDALARLHSANEHFLVFNRVIEVLPHFSLSSRARFASLGWAPDEIHVAFSNESFDASEILACVGGRRNYDPPNGRKFCLADRSLGGTDTALSLHLRETDYFTIRSVLSCLTFALRSEFGSLDPARSHIPQSLCLHFIVRCSDGSVLLLLNEGRKAYAGGTWSVSAEEQLKGSDLTDSYPLLSLFKRALLEEVFGLSDELVPLSSRWIRIEQHVHSLKIWSLFLEEQINNFSLLGVCQLSSAPATLRDAVKQLIDDGSAARDLEGELHFASADQLQQLLICDNTKATALFSGQERRVLAENLHWTSRYRMFRLLRALKGEPLVPPSMT